MTVALGNLGWLWEQITSLLAMPNVQFAVFLGGLMLLAAFLLLRYTRLGQARLIWKCATLSLLAHILLMIYAYGTYFAGLGAPTTNRQGVAVRLVEATDLDLNSPTSDDLPDWEEFTNDQVMPEVNQLEQPLQDPELEIERVFPETDSIDIPIEPLTAAVPQLLDAAASQPPRLDPNEIGGHSDGDNTDSSPVAVDAIPDQRVADESPTSPEFEPLEIRQDGPAVLLESQTVRQLETPSPDIASPDSTIPELPKLDVPEISTSQPIKPAELTPIIRERDFAHSRIADAQPMPKLYSLRSSNNRRTVALARGGTIDTEQAVEDALKWLAANQSSDGRWDPRLSGGGRERMVLGEDRRGAGSQADNGITGLVLLAFLASGNSHMEGPYKENVGRGVQFLLATQSPDGFMGGSSQHFERMYCHSIATLAVSETLAMTGDARLLGPVQRAVDYSTRGQHPVDGGWRYKPGDAGDMSQFGWQVLALHSAELGGASIPGSTRDGMNRFLFAATSGRNHGFGCYRPGERPSPTMTAEALVCRYLLETQVSLETIDEATQYLMKNLPTEEQVNYYYWYYSTMCLFHTGGKPWEQWNERLQRVLLARQIQSGANAGAWPADGLWSGYGGQFYSTAMAALCLEVYYRYLPVYEFKNR